MRPASGSAVWVGISFGREEQSCMPSRSLGPEALGPAAHDLGRHAGFPRRLGFGKAAGDVRKRHLLSTTGRQTGILVNVHSGCS